MNATRSTYDPISRYLAAGERVIWRHQPAARTLFYNRLPALIIVLLMTAGVATIGWNIVTATMAGPIALGAWSILPAGIALFFLMLLYFFARAAWSFFGDLLDSRSTHYALTDRRFMIASERGILAYDASHFHRMDARGGAPGTQVLLFDWGPNNKGQETFHNRIAALPDAQKLERLIRDTLRA